MTASPQVHAGCAMCASQIQTPKTRITYSGVQVVSAGYEPKVPVNVPPYSGEDKSARTRFTMLSGDERPAPETWSPEESFYKTGATPGPEPYVANENGGALRRTHLYNQDRINSKCANEVKCKQDHPSKKKLGPGLMVRRHVQARAPHLVQS